MYDYSPLRKLYIKDFRNLGEVEIDFSQSPIITLLGDNEAGKTSVVKAFATCALHADPRDQKDYIRDGTKMFGVAIELTDGTRVVRMKEASGVNSYQVIKPDGTKWATNKITDGLPLEVQSVMGLIEEPENKEFLHIRTYEDKLLFVVTPASANYKVMYNALKVENLTKAIKLGSNEVNQLKSSINTNESSINTLNSQIRDIDIIDTEPLINIRNSLQKQLALLDKLEKAKLLSDKVDNCENQLGALALLDVYNLQPISEMVTSKLITVNRLLNNKLNLENYKSVLNDANNLEIIDYSNLLKCKGIIDRQNILNDKITDAGALSHVSEISEVSELLVSHLYKLRTLLDKKEQLSSAVDISSINSCTEIDASMLNSVQKTQKVISLMENISVRNSELEQINSYIQQVNDYLKNCGVAIESCPKCGEAVIFDIDKI